MSSEAWFRVFLDADVLAAPLTRTLLLLCGSHEEAAFGPRWSLAVEAEADRHLRPGQTRMGELRRRFEWDSDFIVAAAVEAKTVKLSGTAITDRHVLAAASQAGIGLIVSRNVSDFGQADLAALNVAVVHPDLFLSRIVTAKVYREVLGKVAEMRTREPNTSEALHAALGAEHPRLHAAMAEVFPGVEAATSQDKPPAAAFRGTHFTAGNVQFREND